MNRKKTKEGILMANIILNQIGQAWNGKGFGGAGLRIETMDQLNTEAPKIAQVARGKMFVVQEGCTTTENAVTEFEV
jgi:hypothetical protein